MEARRKGLIALRSGPGQLAYFHRAAGFEVRIAGHKGFYLIDAFGGQANIAREVPGDLRRFPRLANADSIADLAAALKRTALPKLLQVGLPRRVVNDNIVVHEQDVVGHIYLPKSTATFLLPAGFRCLLLARNPDN